MNDSNRRSATKSRNAEPIEVSGVLETVAAGLSLVFSKPWLIAVPLLVDLMVWLGIQVSAQPLVSATEKLLIEQGGSNGPEAAEEIVRVSENLRVNDVLASLVPSIFSGLPNDTLLASLLGVLTPSLTSGVDRSNLYPAWSEGLGRSVVPGNGAAVIVWAIAFFLVGTLALAVFKAPIAQVVRGGTTSFGKLGSDIALGWIRILGLVGLIAGGLIILFIPLVLAAILVALLGVNLITLLSLAIFVVGSIGALYLYFLLDAMFIYRVGPIRAARMSYSVARINFAQAWRFAATTILLSSGVLHIWSVLIENPPGLIASLALNAFLGTGLSIASMMFFHDRARLPRPAHMPRLSPSRRPK